MKKTIKYLNIFIVIVSTLTLLLVLVAKIPRKYVEKNLIQAGLYFENNLQGIKRVEKNRDYTYIHKYPDGIILNIIYCIDSEHPLKSIAEDKYYTADINDNTNSEYLDLISKNLSGNTQYMRYWHGSIIIIKPLLILFTIQQIYIINAIIMTLLIGILLYILIRKKYYPILIAFIIGFIGIAGCFIPFSCESTWAFEIMLIVSILGIIFETKGQQERITTLLFLSGIFTCFFDFLTNEIITLIIPMIIILSIRYKENKMLTTKKEITYILKLILIWILGYTSMWIAKWTLDSLILKVNSLDFVIPELTTRINGAIQEYSIWEIRLEAIQRNFTTLFPINIIKDDNITNITILAIIIITIITLVDKKDKNKIKLAIEMFIISLLPYIRYIILANHSYKHYFFTFRCQIITIMAICLIYIYCTDKKILFSKIKKGMGIYEE